MTANWQPQRTQLVIGTDEVNITACAYLLYAVQFCIRNEQNKNHAFQEGLCSVDL